jgi:hypothetical protein
MWPHFRVQTDTDWFFRRLGKYPRLAHHPVCECFDNHLIRFGNLAFCLGCFCLASGIVATIAALITLHLASEIPEVLQTTWGAWTIGALLYAPAMIQPFWQARLAKIIFRTALGVSIVSLWYGTIFTIPWDLPGLTLKLGFLLAFCWTFRLSLKFRERHTHNPLVDCERGCYPLCEGNRRHLERLLRDLRQRCGESDPEFVRFAEGFINGDESTVEVEHFILD